MTYTVITVPEKNDSMSSIVLCNTQYIIRFTYDDTGDFWKFGLYTALKEPIRIGIKIVPQFPLTLFSGSPDVPYGEFGVLTDLDRVGKDDFKNEKAKFAFIPFNQ